MSILAGCVHSLLACLLPSSAFLCLSAYLTCSSSYPHCLLPPPPPLLVCLFACCCCFYCLLSSPTSSACMLVSTCLSYQLLIPCCTRFPAVSLLSFFSAFYFVVFSQTFLFSCLIFFYLHFISFTCLTYLPHLLSYSSSGISLPFLLSYLFLLKSYIF